MKLAIDLQACQTDSRERGIGRYAMSLARHLIEQMTDSDEAVLLLDAVDTQRLQDVRRRLRQDNVKAATGTFGYPSMEHFTDLHTAVSSAGGLLRSKLVEAVKPDVLLVTSFFEVGGAFTTALDWEVVSHIPKAVIAYDLIPALFPEHYLPDGHFISDWYREKLQQFKKFDLFLAISQATRNDLIEILDIDPERIRVIGAGLDWELLKEDIRPAHTQDAVLAALGITQPFVLMVGNADWRKNSIGALEAFAALPDALRKSHQLIFTRVGDDVRNALAGKFAHVAKQVVIAGTVDELTLSLLYKRCAVFFFPSLYEGFGLPVLEAMALGAPVLSSSLAALPEVVHDVRTLFDPRDKAASAAILQRALEDETFRSILLEGASKHAHDFNWDKCASVTLKTLRDLAGATSHKPSLPWQPTDDEICQLADAVVTTGENGMDMLGDGLERINAATRRRILIDITEVVRLDARSGIQRVVRNYCKGLMRAAREPGATFDVEPVWWTEQGMRYARQYARDRLGELCEGQDAPLDVRPNDVAYMVDSSWWAPSRFDEFHRQIRAAGGEVIWQVYDLVPIYWADFCDPVMPPVFQEWMDHVLRTSDGCICISEATRQDLLRYATETLPPHAAVPWSRSMHLGSDLEFGQVTTPTTAGADVVMALGDTPWLLAISTVEPRKDYTTILDAYDILWKEGMDVGLVIIGKEGWNITALADAIRSHAENGKRLFWLENATDGDVQCVLRNATALIQASRAEGFGLAVAEAGSLGIPLILSDIPVFREIAEDKAHYFEVGSPASLAKVLGLALKKPGLQPPSNMKVMTWAESSRRLLDLLL